jgi:ABC-type hemin transport system ATPase subunit
MVLPFQPLAMAFDNVNYYVDMPSEMRQQGVEENRLQLLPGVKGLSTEQRKIDEPTSRLDARAAAIVMRMVRNTVDTGRTVVRTIHQPSIDIFEAFNELMLMK